MLQRNVSRHSVGIKVWLSFVRMTEHRRRQTDWLTRLIGKDTNKLTQCELISKQGKNVWVSTFNLCLLCSFHIRLAKCRPTPLFLFLAIKIENIKFDQLKMNYSLANNGSSQFQMWYWWDLKSIELNLKIWKYTILSHCTMDLNIVLYFHVRSLNGLNT